MSRRLKSLPTLEGDQRLASDPSAHASLSASAGTGKTQVLTARVLRLLLGGVPPQAILCLTFTKAGAAEMANRLGERLAAWVRMDEAALGADLLALDEDVGPAARRHARQLFARVIEAPGGLRIQTIHSFAQTLLAGFPAEAGIAPGFQPIEGRAEAELARRTLAALLADAESQGDAALLADVSALSKRLGETGAESYLMDCARAPDAIALFAVPGAAEAWLHKEIGLPDGSVEEHLARHCGDDSFDCDLLHTIAAANRSWGTSSGAKIVDSVALWLALAPAERAAALPDLASIIFTQKGDLRKVQAGQSKADPSYQAHVERLAEAIRRLLDIQRGAAFAAAAASGLRAGARFAAAYASAKRAEGVADFNDLIRWTRALLERPGMGEWIRFKLDQRTDHVLVDEAQDTNADQWAIVDALVGEFFSGAPEAERRWRTLFMVGDYKQAIYSFQGTDPRQFDRYRNSIGKRALGLAAAATEDDGPAREFRDLSISASFRSSQAVLDVVDALIGEIGHGAMGLSEPPPLHVAHHAERPGTVELWPPYLPARLAANDDGGEEEWVDEPLRLYADRIARQVRAWIDEAKPLASTGRALTAGDILILVRSRTELASLIVARLYALNVPVAGIDRLHLSKPLAVKDLLSAITFAVQPHDDLNLGGLLVSPLVGFDQDQLFDLAYDRGKSSLWAELQRRRDEGGAIADAHILLEGLLRMADFVTPAHFLETILSGPIGGRRKLIERLGEAARDPIEALLSGALEFEARETPSLDRFLAWFASGDVEVKRDPSAASNAVRVMTVHGAKGLEAPVVLLADATHDPAKVGGASAVMDVDFGGSPVPLLRPRAEERVEPFRSMLDRQKADALEEHWRLLYVGLTRAAERLVIAGVMPSRGVVGNSWHASVARSMTALEAESAPDDLWGETLRFTRAGTASKGRKSPRLLPPPPRPDWIDRAAPIEERPPRPLAPSAIGDKDEAPPPSPAQRAAARRGTLLHALFDRLPGVAPAERPGAALTWLVRAGVPDEAVRAEIAGSALAVIDDPRFADLFSPEALSEAPIAATLPDGRVIAGTVDRLCIGEDKVRVIDFKTGRAVPEGSADVPTSHRAQMTAYADALRVIFPGREIEPALLYTHGPRLILLDG